MEMYGAECVISFFHAIDELLDEASSILRGYAVTIDDKCAQRIEWPVFIGIIVRIPIVGNIATWSVGHHEFEQAKWNEGYDQYFH